MHLPHQLFQAIVIYLKRIGLNILELENLVFVNLQIGSTICIMDLSKEVIFYWKRRKNGVILGD